MADREPNPGECAAIIYELGMWPRGELVPYRLMHHGRRLMRAFFAVMKAQQAEPVQPAAWVDAYDMIDRFLRNNLRDDDYAEYSAALDSLYTAPQQRKPLTDEEIEQAHGIKEAK